MKVKQPDKIFDFDQVAGTAAFLTESLTGDGTDLTKQVGRYPGTWTLPVCDASTWGASWNSDYTNITDRNDARINTHPPCLCGKSTTMAQNAAVPIRVLAGPQGSETNAWAAAAGMTGFETFWYLCTDALEDKNFQWPEGVTEVKYPTNDGKNEYTVRKPR